MGHWPDIVGRQDDLATLRVSYGDVLVPCYAHGCKGAYEGRPMVVVRDITYRSVKDCLGSKVSNQTFK